MGFRVWGLRFGVQGTATITLSGVRHDTEERSDAAGSIRILATLVELIWCLLHELPSDSHQNSFN